MKKKQFTKRLLQWDKEKNHRQLPWKNEKDPYKVWISEVILQQTRVEQGWDYYNRFIETYPTLSLLAVANEEEVFKLWEGLGYYTRCRNLLFSARYIYHELNGEFPKKYEDIIKLKGIGSYTAAAIASFCFNLPTAVVDGNVFRILSRIFGIKTPIDSTEGKKVFQQLANEVLDKTNPGRFNQAIMDFGATVCKPLPDCVNCDLSSICAAFTIKKVNFFPVKGKKIKRKIRWFSYFIFESSNNFWIRKRDEKDIWQNLYEFYPEESESDPEWSPEKILIHAKKILGTSISKEQIAGIIRGKKQTLTHQHIEGYFIHIRVPSTLDLASLCNGFWIDKEGIKTIAFPNFIHQFLKELHHPVVF